MLYKSFHFAILLKDPTMRAEEIENRVKHIIKQST